MSCIGPGTGCAEHCGTVSRLIALDIVSSSIVIKVVIHSYTQASKRNTQIFMIQPVFLLLIYIHRTDN